MLIIKVRYNGRRFPRVASFRGGGNTSFRADRMVLDLEEYDAMLLLKSNSRLTPDKWEFTIEGVEKQGDIPSKEELEKNSISVEKKLKEEQSQEVKPEKSKPRGRPKGGKK